MLRTLQLIAVAAVLGSYALVARLPQYRYLFGRPSFAGDFFQLLGVLLFQYAFYSVILYPRFFSPLRNLPGPKGNNFFMGQYFIMNREKVGYPIRRWTQEIPNGGLMRYLDMFNFERVLVVSPLALREMLVTKCYDFIKPQHVVRAAIYFYGAGMPFVEGDIHTHQKKTMQPAFSFRHVKDLYPVFWRFSKDMVEEVSKEVERDAGKPKITNGKEHPTDPDQAVINVVRWFKTITLDIMGIAGMGQDFEARKNKESNTLVKAYREMFEMSLQAAIVFGMRSFYLGWLVPWLHLPKNAQMEAGKEAIRDTCRQLIRAKAEKLKAGDDSDVDILSVALQSEGFTEESLIDQITTFLLAGHETTAVSMTWACYGLCQHPDVQTRLRAEIRANLPSPVGASDVNSLDIARVPYLTAVCNEILRFYDIFVWTRRQAAVDTSLLGQPIPEGTMLDIPFTAIHRDKTIWGEDADKFNPDRWMPDENSKSNHLTNGGATSNFGLLTFLHGPRSCIGEAFARAEFACLLAAWVGKFECELNDKWEMDEANLVTAGGFTVGPVNGLDVRIRIVDGW